MIHRHHLATVVQHPTGGGGEAILQIEGIDVKYDAECCFRIIVFLIELANFKNIWWSSFVAGQLGLKT